MIEKMYLVRDGAAEALKQVMEDEKLSQTDLATMVGISRQSIQQSLNQKSKNMRVATMVKILNAMDYDLAIVRTKGA